MYLLVDMQMHDLSFLPYQSLGIYRLSRVSLGLES